MRGFFIFCSALLIVTGLMKLLIAQRDDQKRPGGVLARPGFIWTGFIIVFGVLGLLVGLGVLPVIRFRSPFG